MRIRHFQRPINPRSFLPSFDHSARGLAVHPALARLGLVVVVFIFPSFDLTHFDLTVATSPALRSSSPRPPLPSQASPSLIGTFLPARPRQVNHRYTPSTRSLPTPTSSKQEHPAPPRHARITLFCCHFVQFVIFLLSFFYIYIFNTLWYIDFVLSK